MPSDGKEASDSQSASLRLGQAVRERRRALGLGQAEVCALAGVGPVFLYELEHGKATVRLDKLLDVLDVLGLELSLREGKQRLSIEPSLANDVP